MEVVAYCHHHLPSSAEGFTQVCFSPYETLRAAEAMVAAYSGFVDALPARFLGDEMPSIIGRHLVDGREFVSRELLVSEMASIDYPVLLDLCKDTFVKVRPLGDMPTHEDAAAWRLKWARKAVKVALREEDSVYLKFSFATSVGQGSIIMNLMETLRQDNFIRWSDGIVSDRGGLLCLVGGQGARTALHMDWNSAVNVAFAVLDEGESETVLKQPVAKWTFFHPDVIPHLDGYLKEAGYEEGLKGRIFIEEGMVDDFLHKQGIQDWSYPLVYTEYQYSGMKINVPVGWAHQVENLRDCVKFAFDVYKPEEFGLCMESYQNVASPYFDQDEDYMATTAVLLRAACEACGGMV
jgi:hypothetical protein